MGIAMNVKNQRLLWDLYASIVMNLKESATIIEPICGYYIFENGLMEFRIENGLIKPNYL
jgi:hypothetical protein